MRRFLTVLVAAAMVCVCGTVWTSANPARASGMGVTSSALMPQGRVYGPYSSYEAAQAKSSQLQAQGYATVVTRGHYDYNNWYVAIVD
jgi:hypothetical protein